MMKTSVKKLCVLSLAVALAMILSFVESQIPPLVPISGVKIGLANIVVIFVLYSFGWLEAAAVSFVRVILVSLLFASIPAMAYSIAGAALSFAAMVLIKKLSVFSSVGVSVVGGVFHNVGQIIMAGIILGTSAIITYLPVLIVSGIVAGIIVGILGGILTVKLRKIIDKY